jgi:hypothetical protein
MVEKRVYKKGAPGSEYDAYQASPEQKKRRAQRNAARRELGRKVGDPREAGHAGANRKGPLGSKVKAESFKTNRAKQPKRNGEQD